MERAIKIADVGCGSGTLSYHLNKYFKSAEFYLYDYYKKAIGLAKQINKTANFHFEVANIYTMPVKDCFFDFVFCWQTLLWLEEPQKGLSELARIVKPGGEIYACSLFNIEHDVDIYAKIYDRTRHSGQKNISINYNTISFYTVKKWLAGKVSDYCMHPFHIGIDLPQEYRGIGTYTRDVRKNKERLQISGGYLMNWGILEVTK
jgi:ubiquinone/menaquinone biosynthesis C-methylase UbiE